jgi:hypothetical protein
MSKFLRFIVNIFLICAILVAAAILIPPLVGIQTTIVDTASMDTNLPLGSITYSTDVDASEIKVGDEVLKDNNTSTYAYIVKKIDKSSDTFTVVNAEDQDAENEEITLRNSVPKVAVVVPYIGYVIIAMHSTEGILVIALVVVLIIILFILSELWKEKPEEDEEDEEDDDSKKTYSFIEEDDSKELGGAGELVTGDAPEKAEADEDENAGSEAVETDLTAVADDAVTETEASTAEISREKAENSEDKVPDEETDSSETDDSDAETSESETSASQEPEEALPDDESTVSGDTQKFDFHLSSKEPATDAQEEIGTADIDQDDVSDVKIPDLKRSVETPEDISRILSEPDEDTETETGAEQAEETDESRNEADSSVQGTDDGYDLSAAIEQATHEAEEQAEQDAAEKAKATPKIENAKVQDSVPADAPNNIEETQTENPDRETEETPEQFVPVEHATLDELMDEARKAGDEPDVSKDEATGITVVDYSGVL